MENRTGAAGAFGGGTAAGQQARGPDAGYRALVSAMVLSLVNDLAILRRAGCWEQEVEELDEWMAGLEDRTVMRSHLRNAWQLGMTDRRYMEHLCAVMWGALGIRVTPEQIVAAARRGRPAQRRQGGDRRRKVKLDGPGTMAAANDWLRERGVEPGAGQWRGGRGSREGAQGEAGGWKGGQG